MQALVTDTIYLKRQSFAEGKEQALLSQRGALLKSRLLSHLSALMIYNHSNQLPALHFLNKTTTTTKTVMEADHASIKGLSFSDYFFPSIQQNSIQSNRTDLICVNCMKITVFSN